MKQGKLTENVLKRSVLRRIGTYREEMQKGAALGQDCAFFSWKEETLATTTQTAALPVKDAGRLVVYAADNNLAAAGAQTIGISLALTIPETLEGADAWNRRHLQGALHPDFRWTHRNQQPGNCPGDQRDRLWIFETKEGIRKPFKRV